MPVLEGWHKKYARQGLVVIGITEDATTVAAVKKTLHERGITYPVVIDRRVRLFKQYGLAFHPVTFVIDRTGKVVKTELGYVRGDEKEIAQAMLPLLRTGKGSRR